jgi:hypothetical protein
VQRHSFVAYADLGELAPPLEQGKNFSMMLKNTSESHTTGLQLFFDAELTCPKDFCPSSGADFMANCPHPNGLELEYRRRTAASTRTVCPSDTDPLRIPYGPIAHN